jgi:hypothetical protein
MLSRFQLETFRPHFPLLRRLAQALPLLALAACGSDSSDSGSTAVTFALTDGAAEEITSFRVSISSIQLERASGALVSLLTQAVPVDLTSLQDLSQVLGTTPVPPGFYVGATVTFDFTNAEAYILDATTPASLLDEDGDPLSGSVPFDIQLAAPFSLGAGAHKLIELDFDLNQSLEVDSLSNEITVEPKLVLSFDPSAPKELVSFGELVSVDTANGSFELELMTLQGQAYGSTTVDVLPQTIYQINGVPYTGSTGLAALAALPAGTWAQTYGAIAPNLPNLTIAYIEAGSGTYNGGNDIVEGNVIGRSGGAGSNATLEVRGFSDNADHSSLQFNTTFLVDVSLVNTKVLRRGSATVYDTDDITIGQRVRIFGDLVGTDMDATASQHVLRLLPTRALGVAAAAPSGGELEIDLVRIGLFPANSFDWPAGGTTPTDPDALIATVGTAADDLEITNGTTVDLIGWFNPIDSSGADFEATAVINRDLGPSLLVIKNRAGGLVADLDSTQTQVSVALSGTLGLGELAIVDKGFIAVQSLAFTPTPTITSANANGLFSLIDKVTGSYQIFGTLANLDIALSIKLGQGAELYDLAAIGQFNATTNSLAATVLTVVVN